MNKDHKKQLHKSICDTVYITQEHSNPMTNKENNGWIFDFRTLLMNGQFSHTVSELFEEQFIDQYPFQICALEIAGVPLATSLMNHLYHKGYTDVNAFFIRKSRKKTGLLNMIEGTILPDVPIILVDDIMNTGSSFWRQIEVLEDLGHRVHTVWSILQYRNNSYYTRFDNRSIDVSSVFMLDDFTDPLGDRVQNLIDTSHDPIPEPFTPQWVFKSTQPNLELVFSKSQPVIDDQYIYVGSEGRNLWCINQDDGSVVWNYRVPPSLGKKNILSNPTLYNNLVIFGSYDGNLYALDKNTGEKQWTFWDADYIGSSPCVAANLRLIYVGMEFGLIKRHGGIACIDADTGTLVWADYTHPAFTHASPLYIQKHREVVIGSNDGKIRMYNARTGEKKWECTTFGGTDYDALTDGGFGSGDIKESCVYDSTRDYVIFGSIDGFLYIVNRSNGQIVFHYKAVFAIYSTPCLYGNLVIFTSVDKHVRAINLDTHQLVWDIVPDATRIFSSPVIINDLLYIGTNAARLHEINPLTGEIISYFQGIERITNQVIYNSETDCYFLPTFANEIVKLTKSTTDSSKKTTVN